jgi:hypothetical protein
MKLRLTILTVILLVSILLGIVNADTNRNIDFSQKIIELIANEKTEEILKLFDVNINLSEKVPLESFKKNDYYGGFLSRKGLLYAIFFDINKAQGKWKKLLNECGYSSLKIAFTKSKNIQCSLDSNPPQIACEFDKKVYNIFFKKNSNYYCIVEISLSSTFEDDKCW